MPDILPCQQGIAQEGIAAYVLPVHVQGADPAVFVGGVVISTLPGGAAGCVPGEHIAVAARDLGHGVQNVEKVADGSLGLCVGLGECGAPEPGWTAQIPWQVCLPVQKLQLMGKGGIIGQHAHGVIVDVQPIPGGFHRQCAGAVRDDPVEPGAGESSAEIRPGQAEDLQQRSGVIQIFAPAKDPGEEFEGGDPVPARMSVPGKAGEIQPGHAKPGLVHGIVKEGITIFHMGHAHDGQMPGQVLRFPEGQRKIPGRKDHLLPIGPAMVQGPAKIKLLTVKSDGSTHRKNLRAFFLRMPGGGGVMQKVLYFMGTCLANHFNHARTVPISPYCDHDRILSRQC